MIREVLKKTWTPPPINVDYVFITIVLLFFFQFLDIIFSLKLIKTWKVDLARNPPPPLWT